MPKVTFVNEHRTVEVPSGRKISDVAKELGIAVCREEFAGTGIGNWTVWVKGEPGALSAPGFFEKLGGGGQGMKRFANKAKILGDVEIWTQGGLGDRLRAPRPVDGVPTPRTDASAPRLGVSAAGTAAFPYGHPAAVGNGTRPAVARNTGKPKAKGAAAETEADDDEAEADE